MFLGMERVPRETKNQLGVSEKQPDSEIEVKMGEG